MKAKDKPTASVGMKDFYRQSKNIKSSKSSKPSTTFKKSPNNSSTIGSQIVQPSSLISHGTLDLKEDYDENEEMLRQFDMNMAYGPCAGMTRLARWERARNLGLNPPKEIGELLKRPKVNSECLWDDRI